MKQGRNAHKMFLDIHSFFCQIFARCVDATLKNPACLSQILTLAEVLKVKGKLKKAQEVLGQRCKSNQRPLSPDQGLLIPALLALFKLFCLVLIIS